MIFLIDAAKMLNFSLQKFGQNQQNSFSPIPDLCSCCYVLKELLSSFYLGS